MTTLDCGLVAEYSDPREEAYALDNSRPAVNFVAVGHGQFIHTGWIHSHSARLGRGRGPDPLDPRSKPGALRRAASLI